MELQTPGRLSSENDLDENEFEIEFESIFSPTPFPEEEGRPVPISPKECLDCLTELFDFFVETTELEAPKLFKTEPKLPVKSSFPSVNFGFDHMKRISKKYQERWEFINNKCSTYILLAISRVRAAVEADQSDYCDFDRLCEYVMGVWKNDPTLLSLKHNILALGRYITKYYESPRIPKIPMQQMRAILREASLGVNTTTEFVPMGIFEDFYNDYVISEDQIATFDEMAERMCPSIEPSPSPVLQTENLNAFVDSQVKSLQPSSEEQYFVVKCGIIRILFDRVFLRNPVILGYRDRYEEFHNKCVQISQLTPRILGIEEILMKKEHMEMTMNEIAQSSPIIQKAQKEIDSVQFFSNPIDIASSIFRSMKYVENFVAYNSIEGDMTELIDPNVQLVSSQSRSMSFDDFFALFFAIFALNPPSNAIAISQFLSSLHGTRLSDPFQFAISLFTSCVNYTFDIDIEVLKREAKSRFDPSHQM